MKKYNQFLKYFSIFFIQFFAIQATGQQELNLHFLPDIWQTNITNPALLPEKRTIVLALPSVYFNVNSPKFTLSNISATENGKTVLRLDSLVRYLDPADNRLNLNFETRTLGIAFSRKKWTFSLEHAVKGDGSLLFSRDLVAAFTQGNRRNPLLQMQGNLNLGVYSEIGLGVAYKMGALTLGGRAKLLSGVAGTFTERDKLTIKTDTLNYNLQFDTDFSVLTFGTDAFSYLTTNPLTFAKSRLITKNRGMAFDIGATYKVGKLTIAASLIDVGATIKWQEAAKTYRSQGTYYYRGLNGDKLFNLDSLGKTEWQDTLKRIVNLQEGNSATYETSIPQKMYLSATLQISKKLTLGGLIYSESRPNDTRRGYVINAQYKLWDILSIGGSYAARNNKFDNIGLSAVLNLKFIQIYAVTDNALGALQLANAHNANGRIGANVKF
jgi:hypothetical protein